MADELTLDAGRARPQPIREYEIRGGGGTTLHACEWGNPAGAAIIFIHGWSQCELCWTAQVDSPLAESFRMVTFDNRGHGMSEKPQEPSRYADERLWADDLAAVIDQTGLDRPVLVAWSYGGFIATDYVSVHGDADIAGIDLVGGGVLLQPPSFTHLGPGMLENASDACQPDLAANIRAIRRFLRACTAQPLDDELWTAALCWNMVVPPAVRGALIAREIDGADVLASLAVPVLLSHGREDRIVLPAMAEYAQEHCVTATFSWYDGVGHMPFVEDAARFNDELAAFVEQANDSAKGARGRGTAART
ncbi:MAG TPA: alpha/beta hydrolase [Solirubrobacteraceae bacterium]|nr:alpha/beta hydrolase [Solirubrobacteraceae bacterium]